MNTITTFSNYELAELKNTDFLANLYDHCFKKEVPFTFTALSHHDYYWGAERYNLQFSSAFLRLNRDEQTNILATLTRKNLSLAYFIEKMGTSFGPRMMDYSDSIEEKALYALFTAEECQHLYAFRSILGEMPVFRPDFHPMLPLLDEVIREGEKMTLVHVVQVLLEGFGLSFYAGLKDSCLNPTLKSVYATILGDETRHHGAGIIVSQQRGLTAIEKEQIFEYSRDFILSLQKADWILESMIEVGGEISNDQKLLFREETKQEETYHQRRLRLKQMLSKADPNGELVKRLEKEKVI